MLSKEEDLKELKDCILDTDMVYLTAGRGQWKQKDGEVKLISNMDESHIRNCIKTIERDIEQLHSRPQSLRSELTEIAMEKLEELKEAYINRI